MKKQILGEVIYNGKIGTAVREMYEDCWKFIIEIDGERHVLMNY